MRRGRVCVFCGSSSGSHPAYRSAAEQVADALVSREVAHRGIPDPRIVHSMHERQALMAELSDAFLALPGGFGTFEEFPWASTIRCWPSSTARWRTGSSSRPAARW